MITKHDIERLQRTHDRWEKEILKQDPDLCEQFQKAVSIRRWSFGAYCVLRELEAPEMQEWAQRFWDLSQVESNTI